MRRIHAQEIDLRAVQAVCRAGREGHESGRREALREMALANEGLARRRRHMLVLAVITAFLIGFSAGLFLGATSPRAREMTATSGRAG